MSNEWEPVGAKSSNDGWETVGDGWEEVGKKRNTTLAEDFQIGLGQAGSTVTKGLSLLGGGAASALGATDIADKIYSGGEELAKSVTDYWTPVDAEQSFGGKVAGTFATLPMQLLAMPFSPAETGMQMLENNEPLHAAVTGSLIDTAGNVAGMAVPGAFGTKALTKAATGAGSNALQDFLTKKAISGIATQDKTKGQFAPTGESAALAGILGGALGSIDSPTQKAKPSNIPPKPDAFGVREEFVPKNKPLSEGELKILSYTSRILEDKIKNITGEIKSIETAIGKTGEAAPELTEHLQQLEKDFNKALADKAQLEIDLEGKTTNPKAVEERIAQRVEDFRNEIFGIREEAAPTYRPEDIPTKTSPVKVALTKIGEAMNEPMEKVEQRWVEANKKLNALEEAQRIDKNLPGEEYNALREALNREIDAYESILKGEKPDLSWAKQNESVKVQKEAITLDDTTLPKEPFEIIDTPLTNRELPTGNEVATLLRGKKTMGDVFDTLIKEGVGTKGQKQLLAILNRIPHIRSALFKFGTAIEKDGKFSKGAYDPNVHTVELHKDGNIKTVLHEAIHAATHALLADGKSAAAKRLNTLFQEFKQKNPDKTNYGMTNIHEFISEAFTSAEFQKVLASIGSYTQGTKPKLSLYTKFKNIVKEALNIPEHVRTVFDDVIYAGSDVLELARIKPETFFQKLSEKAGTIGKVADTTTEYPTVRNVRGIVKRNFFGMQALEGFYRDHPVVQQNVKIIRDAAETADRISNELWYGTANILQQGKVRVFDTLGKVKDDASAYMTVKMASNQDMAAVHDVFKKGFEECKDYSTNLKDNGQNLTPKQQEIYMKLSTLFKRMYEHATQVQQGLNKKHLLPYREGWYPAKRMGEFYVEVAYRGNVAHVEYFKTKQAAEVFRRRISDGKNLKHLTVSETLEKGQEAVRPNQEMAEIIGDKLAQLYPTGGTTLKKNIQDLMDVMSTRGGKLGHHHQQRTNLPGYKGSELFKNKEEIGGSFKEGIQGEVNNFTMNMKALITKTKLDPYFNDPNSKAKDPVGFAASEQMYDSALGRNKQIFGLEKGTKVVNHAVDSMVDAIAQKIFKTEFVGKEKTALGHLGDTTMRLFYATKMVAKPVFILGQFLTTPMVIPELARDGHGLRAAYSFGKAITQMSTGNKALWDHLKEVSQMYNVMEPQFRESLNLERTTGKEGWPKKFLNAVEDYVFLGKVGQAADSMSRLISYASAYTHFKDLGLDNKLASEKARQVTDKSMNVYDSANAAPIFEKLGVIGNNMKPLSSFALNQLGNLVSYIHEAKRGHFGPLISYGMIATAMGGVISLPFVQEYERWRKVAEEYFDIQMPGILEIMVGDDGFLDRLKITDQDIRDAVMYGQGAFSGIDLGSSIRSNETMFSLMAAIAMGQEDASKLLPVLSASYDTAKQIPTMLKVGFGGDVGVAEGRKAVDQIISGPIGYGIKEFHNLNTTRLFGKPTGMISTGKAGDADIPRTKTDIVAGLLGTRSIAQRELDNQMIEMGRQDKMKQQKKLNLINKYVETGDETLIPKLVELGMDQKQIQSAIENSVYAKSVDQHTRYYQPRKGKARDEKVINLFSTFKKREKEE